MNEDYEKRKENFTQRATDLPEAGGEGTEAHGDI
jgi:hypothetical protein